jgi:acetyl esterase
MRTACSKAAWVGGVALALTLITYGALELSPWPAVLVYRFVMNRGGEVLNAALEKHVPPGVQAVLDEPYAPGVALDVFYRGGNKAPTILWIHGGGFLAGDKKHVRNYLRILAANGFTTVALGYSTGPTAHYPTPLRQANLALAYLVRSSERLHVDPSRIYLAGDSAGAHVAAQLANAISVPAYAETVGIAPAIQRAQLRGVILHCGIYDFSLARTDGLYGHFMRTAMWAYSGIRNPVPLPELSVTRYVTAEFPPAFISAGNDDPLLPHSRALAAALTKAGARVDTLFFPDDRKPEVPHEYQFNLDSDAGRLALERTLRFLGADARVVGERRRGLVDEEAARVAGRGPARRRQPEQHGGSGQS